MELNADRPARAESERVPGSRQQLGVGRELESVVMSDENGAGHLAEQRVGVTDRR